MKNIINIKNGPDIFLTCSLAVITLALVFGIVYTAGWGVYDETYVRVGALLLAIVVALGTDRYSKSIFRVVFNVGLLSLSIIVCYRYFLVSEALETGLYELTYIDTLCGLSGLICLGELVRRKVGAPLVFVCALALLYASFGRYLPSFMAHSGIPLNELLVTSWYSFDGVFGRPMAVVTSTILIFILFGAVLEAMGVGDILLKLAFRLTRRLPGGDAHAAVLASGLFGTISGSAVANVVGTGVITIPMIKKRGFSARFAGAVEAAASSGGQLMPPIMGAVAFLMADVTGIPYLDICIAALIPALFYYGSLFVLISDEARRLGMKAAKSEKVERLTRQEWLKVIPFSISLLLIIVLMMLGSTPAKAGFWALITAVTLGLAVDPKLLKAPRVLWRIVQTGATSSAVIILAVGAVGIILAVMNGTGLGLRFAEAIQSVGENSLALSLIMMAAGCLVLGMGMPTGPAYLIIILVMGPAVEALGVPTVAAHLFVVFFAVLSSVTPPVALAAFAAAPIANANPIALSITSLRLSIIGFIIPFVFIYNPSLLIVVEDFSAISFINGLLKLIICVWMLSRFFSLKGLMKIIPALVLIAVFISDIYFLMAIISLIGILFAYKQINSSAFKKQHTR